MCAAERPSAKSFLYKVDELAEQACTRDNVYQKVSEKSGKSVGSLRTAAWRLGQTKTGHSLRFLFSAAQEQALVCACVIHARQGSPMTVLDFKRMASFVAKKEPGDLVSTHFVKDFVHRHGDVLSKKEGKITSPTRSSNTMLERTKEFIDMMNTLIERGVINKSNLLVFDETIIGDGDSCCQVIGERKDSGGGNINVLRTREQALGCYIPFSTVDGKTPFRVMIFKTKDVEGDGNVMTVLAPSAESRTGRGPRRVFFHNNTGFLSREEFAPMMEDFTNWWTTRNPGLHCFLLCDNLPVHRNEDVVKAARTQGVHLINIMPGSSHWFQVHDQLPFANLKKLMNDKKNEIMGSFCLEPEVRRRILLGIFYDSERIALREDILRKSFADVGLWPWNPEKILKICAEHSPVSPLFEIDANVLCIADAIRDTGEKQMAECRRIMSRLDVKTVRSPEKAEKRQRPDEDDDGSSPPGVGKSSDSRAKKSKDISVEPPQKRARVVSACRKMCSVKGCQKGHFRSKKWKICPKCKKNFCPSHLKNMRRHKC